ncbi:MAG: AtpZ/AtpI family protein [Chloroflexota bacterium]|nr:AtpZ/AtpI family protein [Chloroflexota bacterium]
MKRGDGNLWRAALRATSLGWELALPIFGGVLGGYLLDRLVGTRYIFTLSLLMLGIVAGFYNVIRSIQQVDEGSRRQAGREREKEKEGTEQ